MNTNKIKVITILLTFLAFSVVCFALYNSPLSLFDDDLQVNYIKNISFFKLFLNDSFGFFRPVKNLLFYIFMLDKPWGLHFARIFTFVVAFLTYLTVSELLNKICKSKFVGNIGGAFWLLAPTMLATIAWLSCSNIMIMVLSGTSCILLYIKQKECDFKYKKYYLIAVCLLLFINLISYEGGVALIPMIFALDFFLYPDSFKTKKLWKTYLYLLLPCLLYFLILYYVNHSEKLDYDSLGFNNNNIDSRVTNLQLYFSSAWFAIYHIVQWFVPTNSQYIMGYYAWGDVQVYKIILCWGIIVALSVYAFVNRKKHREISLAVSWILLGIVPMSNLLAFRNGPYGDYYMAYSSLGIALLISVLCKTTSINQICKYAISLLLVGYMLYLYPVTLRWVAAWQYPIIMLQNTRTVFPKQIDLCFAEVNWYIQNGQRDLAKQALDLAIKSGVEDVRFAVAYKLWLNGKYSEAYDFLKEDEKTRKSTSWTLYFCGYLQDECLNNDDLAIEYYKKSILMSSRKDGTCLNSMNQLAIIYAEQGKVESALEIWVEIEPLSNKREQIRQNIKIAKRQLKQQSK